MEKRRGMLTRFPPLSVSPSPRTLSFLLILAPGGSAVQHEGVAVGSAGVLPRVAPPHPLPPLRPCPSGLFPFLPLLPEASSAAHPRTAHSQPGRERDATQKEDRRKGGSPLLYYKGAFADYFPEMIAREQ
eukprot:2213248-Rhodomonas_salina.1